MAEWMIYGATGYTGELVAEEAVRCGHRPILAGRSADKLKALAKRLNLDYFTFGLDDEGTIARAISGMKIVYHAAGPFIHTSTPMLRACLAAHVNYVDITGEHPVFENTFAHDDAAKEAGIILISGVGFDVIPTDCLAKYLVDQLPDADRLEIAIAAITKPSAGTSKSGLELILRGGCVRRDGALHPYRLGCGLRTIQFSDRRHTTLPIPWGDLASAYRTTGIPNITTYMAFSRLRAYSLAFTALLADPSRILSIGPVKALYKRVIDRFGSGPDENARSNQQSYVWARVSNSQGDSREAWLETAEGYQFTVLASIRVIERLLEMPVPLIGATTPALAFGADFVLDIPGTKRFDTL